MWPGWLHQRGETTSMFYFPEVCMLWKGQSNAQLVRLYMHFRLLWWIFQWLCSLGWPGIMQKESMGLKEGRFSRFVFDRHYQEGQFACLLRFGEDFGEEVASYLEQHPPLLWLHQLHLRRFTRAASTLHALAFSQKSSASLDIRHRRRMLHLAKLSALAGNWLSISIIYSSNLNHLQFWHCLMRF